MSGSDEIGINMATLVGTLIGQIIFGILGDRLGRKRCFGALLLIMIFATNTISHPLERAGRQHQHDSLDDFMENNHGNFNRRGLPLKVMSHNLKKTWLEDGLTKTVLS
jgi:hypothetical protein